MLNRLSRGLARLLSRAGVVDTPLQNLRGIPSNVCLACGSFVFKVGVMFDEEGDISLWFCDAQCAECDALVTVPTPVDA